MITIEVCYVNPSKQKLISLQVEESCTVLQAIQRSNILVEFPEIDLSVNKVGIFSQPVSLSHSLTAGDRIEIYRPLTMDPKQRRFKKVSKSK